MLLQRLLSTLPFVSLTLSAPTNLNTRDQSTCSLFDPVTSGPYAIQNDIWGATPDGSQSQCSQITSFDGTTVAWSSNFSWSGAQNSVKTYANAQAASITTCKALNQYGSLKTSWEWKYLFPFHHSGMFQGSRTKC